LAATGHDRPYYVNRQGATMSPAAKGPVGSASLPVGRSGHDRPYYVSRPGAAFPGTKGAGRGRPLKAAGWVTL